MHVGRRLPQARHLPHPHDRVTARPQWDDHTFTVLPSHRIIGTEARLIYGTDQTLVPDISRPS